jgi:hypothetical protein
VVAPWSSVGEEPCPPRRRDRLARVTDPRDRVTQRAGYAEAGIRAYWLIDLPAGEIVALRLTETGTYETDAQGATVTVILGLAELTRRPGPALG